MIIPSYLLKIGGPGKNWYGSAQMVVFRILNKYRNKYLLDYSTPGTLGLVAEVEERAVTMNARQLRQDELEQSD